MLRVRSKGDRANAELLISLTSYSLIVLMVSSLALHLLNPDRIASFGIGLADSDATTILATHQDSVNFAIPGRSSKCQTGTVARDQEHNRDSSLQ
jgi:hypothetical protein